MLKICPNCKKEFKTPRKKTIYCNKLCYYSFPVSDITRERMSSSGLGKPKPDGFGKKVSNSTTGKSKPWITGKNNPNYGNKAVDPVKFKIASEKRGLAWTDETKKQHSEKMLGDSNWMRGKTHSQETIDKIKETIKNKYNDGNFNSFTRAISKAEREICNFLTENNIKFISQFIIPGKSHRYDIFLPVFNLIIEYYGDYWHGNPEIYDSNKILGRGTNRYLASKKWKSDENNTVFAINSGYNVQIIWESDFNRDKSEIFRKIIKYGK